MSKGFTTPLFRQGVVETARRTVRQNDLALILTIDEADRQRWALEIGIDSFFETGWWE